MDGDFFCALCLDITSDNSEKDYFVSTECGHIFHYYCLKPAYENGYRDCPICRHKVSMEKLRKLFGIQTRPKPDFKKFQIGASTSSVNTVPEYDHKFKIILVGDAGVGKSCLMQRYADGIYNTNLFSTVGCDWRSKTVEVGGKTVNLSIWDTVGQERHRSLITNYVRDAHGALIVYDISKAKSYTNMEYWYNFVKNFGLSDCVKILVGNKTDLEEQREVPKADGKGAAQKLGIPFFETSAKDAYNVEVVFRTLAATILDNESLVRELEAKKLNPTVRLEDQESGGPVHAVCSYSWYWTKAGFNGMARSLKTSWTNMTSGRRSDDSDLRI